MKRNRDWTNFWRQAVCTAIAFMVFSVSWVSAEELVNQPASEPDAAALQFFETEIRPLLAENCYQCHGPKKQRGKLRLDSLATTLAGGESGPALVPGKPEESLLIESVNYRSLEMPPEKKLSEAQIGLLTRWVKMGAPWPDAQPVRPAVREGEVAVTDGDREFWSFRPLSRPQAPALNDPLVTNPIDAFVLRRLREAGLEPSPPATRRELIRRASFDLIGLPPTPEEVDAFVADDSPDAYENLIDRLLERPGYGERWARHWLDLVRFAQTNGYERDSEKPFAWRYRDYVIRALNEDKPYDRFVLEQLAGDELDDVTDDSIIATAYYRLGVWDDEPDDTRQAVFDELDDVVSTTGSTFLGLTIGCARCHDHKFDPIPQKDYYRLLAFFRNVTYYGKPREGNAGGTAADESVFTELAGGEKTLAVNEYKRPPETTHVLIRGDAGRPSDEVQPRFVQVLCSGESAAKPTLPKTAGDQSTSGRRRALAEWIVSRENPLTARVMANRLWHHHFGRGIVATPNDFGTIGERPTHPELLDWLASELIDGGWRLKRMHKLMMTSSTYRQASRAEHAEAIAADPGNTLLWRQNMRRLQAEALRDAILAASGTLNRQPGGRGVFPELSPEVLSTQSRPGSGWDTSPPEEQTRRSIYIYVKRTLGVPLLESFDAPSPDSPMPARATTTIAPQALILLNSKFMDEQAEAFAQRVRTESPNDPAAQIERAYRIALARKPSPEEHQLASQFIKRQAETWEKTGGSGERALGAFCKLVLNLNEFLYID